VTRHQTGGELAPRPYHRGQLSLENIAVVEGLGKKSDWHATIARLPDARRRLDRVDSLQTAYPVGITGSPIKASNLIVARLWAAQGDWGRAEAAAFRRLRGFNPEFLSTHLLEEGRAAALAGHRTTAIRALQHYLALRYDPEPSVLPEVEAVRAELARLVGEPGS
jgi:hypothetical protein